MGDLERDCGPALIFAESTWLELNEDGIGPATVWPQIGPVSRAQFLLAVPATFPGREFIRSAYVI